MFEIVVFVWRDRGLMGQVSGRGKCTVVDSDIVCIIGDNSVLRGWRLSAPAVGRDPGVSPWHVDPTGRNSDNIRGRRNDRLMGHNDVDSRAEPTTVCHRDKRRQFSVNTALLSFESKHRGFVNFWQFQNNQRCARRWMIISHNRHRPRNLRFSFEKPKLIRAVSMLQTRRWTLYVSWSDYR